MASVLSYNLELAPSARNTYTPHHTLLAEGILLHHSWFLCLTFFSNSSFTLGHQLYLERVRHSLSMPRGEAE